MAHALFVTGTDTDVGKSVVVAALAAAWRGKVHAIKPVASGGDAGPTDARRIADAAGHAPLVYATWQTPVSPHRAALLEEQPLDVQGLLDWLDGFEGLRLVEGVGGWRVPLTLSPRFEVVDLAQHLSLPVVVVAANRLGVLNHTVLTVEAVRTAGLEVVGVVLNDLGGDDASCAHNLDDLNRLLDVPVFAFPCIEPADPEQLRTAGQELAQALFSTGGPVASR